MLVSGLDVLYKAHKGNYAVGAFNINNMEIAQAIVNAAEKLKSPVILQISEGAINYAGLDYIFGIARIAADSSKIPIAIHLDHGRDLGIINECIKIGFTSVMIDASHHKFEDNIRLTKKMVGLAHSHGISVEAELGTIGGAEEAVKSRNIIYTDPRKAKEFVNKTGIDYLAVAIGTSHGAYKFKGDASLEFDILQDIKQRTKVPLVLHGASGIPRFIVNKASRYGAEFKDVSGVPDSQIQKAVKLGINKINTDTDLRIAFDAAVREFLVNKPKDFDPRHILAPARDLIQEVVEHRIKLFGSRNKAK